MKKIIVCLFAICLILTFAVACGDKDADSTNSTDITSSNVSSVVESSDVSSTESTAESEPTMSEIMDWWGNVSLEIE